MISTTGRRPVMAAPTAKPVKPASEIGVSRTRSVPNSSTSPDSTLNGVPASATSSPSMQTRASRRISSARASRTACAKVSSRLMASGIHMHLHFFRPWIRCSDRKIHRGFHLRAYFGFNGFKRCCIGNPSLNHPRPVHLDWIAGGLPRLFLRLAAVVLAVDVFHVMAGVSIGIAEQKGGPCSGASALNELIGCRVDCAHILPIHHFCKHSEGRSTGADVASRGLAIVGVLVVAVVLADVDHGQLPKLGEV